MGTYDCSNGVLSNASTTANTTTPETNYKVNTQLFTEMRNPARTTWTGLGTTVTGSSIDLNPVNTWRAARTAPTSSATAKGNWETLYKGLASALNDWTLAEARYWAYEEAWDTQEAAQAAAVIVENDLKETHLQKVDLEDAADKFVEAAQKTKTSTTDKLTDEIANLGVLQRALTTAHEAKAVQDYLLARANAALTAQQTIVNDWSNLCADFDSNAATADTCFNKLDQLKAIYTTNETNYNTLAKNFDFTWDGLQWAGFYTTARAEGLTHSTDSWNRLQAHLGAVAVGDAALLAAEAALTAAIDTCKGIGYDLA